MPTLPHSLKNPVFARLYAAQTISLLGDALTWVGLALLTFELAGSAHSAVVLSVALTLRVSAFVLFSPLAGSVADRFDRKTILVATHLARMLIVSTLPFVTAIWQIYGLIFALNIFNAFFTPTYKATIPLVTGETEYAQAIALSGFTYEFLAVLGPGLAGSVAAFVGVRQVFFLDGLSFLVAGILILSLPGQMRVTTDPSPSVGRTWGDIREGTTRLWGDGRIRYALLMQLVASVAGAQILVNSVGVVKGRLQLGDSDYGWLMAAFGIGATLSALVSTGLENRFGTRIRRTRYIGIGAGLITLALLPASFVPLPGLIGLWLVAGAGQNSVDLPTQTLIAERIPVEFQGRVYGAHFAWSHLWWGLSYPLAGWLGSHFAGQSFLYGSLIGGGILALVQFVLSPSGSEDQVEHGHEHTHVAIWHDHEHRHDDHHLHQHDLELDPAGSHHHYHHHETLTHTHAHPHDLHHSHAW